MNWWILGLNANHPDIDRAYHAASKAVAAIKQCAPAWQIGEDGGLEIKAKNRKHVERILRQAERIANEG